MKTVFIVLRIQFYNSIACIPPECNVNHNLVCDLVLDPATNNTLKWGICMCRIPFHQNTTNDTTCIPAKYIKPNDTYGNGVGLVTFMGFSKTGMLILALALFALANLQLFPA